MEEQDKKVITLAHGNGGKLTRDLIDSVFIPCFQNPVLAELSDSALLKIQGCNLAFSTDAYVVKPLFFPGGDIGKLAVSGTVNDIAVAGATPLFLSASFIIEEGFSVESMKKIAASIAAAAESAHISIVTGDTKVVEKGSVDGLFVTTSGIGYFESEDRHFSLKRVRPGDDVILSGTIGDHGITILTQREDFPLSTQIKSDCAPLNHTIQKITSAVPPGSIRMMRDPTRGGIGMVLNEFVHKNPFGIYIEEDRIPIKSDVQAICEMTGYDPIYIANEGKILIIASHEESPKIMGELQNDSYGKDAAVIGEVTENRKGKVVMKTKIGGERIVDMLVGDMFPRIC